MIKRSIALTLAAVLWCGQLVHAAPQAITRDDQKDVMVTIYNGNLRAGEGHARSQADAGTLKSSSPTWRRSSTRPRCISSP